MAHQVGEGGRADWKLKGAQGGTGEGEGMRFRRGLVEYDTGGLAKSLHYLRHDPDML
jgi:hypothetical protein